MSPQHHFFVFLPYYFFHPYCWCNPHCLLNINRCGRRSESIRLRFFCSPPSVYLSIYCYHHICFSFDFPWLVCPSVFVFLPSSFSSVPPFSGGRLRNDQSGFDAAGPCPGFPQHMGPGNYKSAPSRLLLLCNAPVWSRRKRRKTKSRRRKTNGWVDVGPHTMRIHFTQKVREFLNIQNKFIPACNTLIGSSLTPPLFLDWEKKVYYWHLLQQHTCGRQEVLGYRGWETGGSAGKMMAPLSPAIIRQDCRGSQKSLLHMIHTSRLPRT